MRNSKVCFLAAFILINSFLLSGCWNYKEINRLGIVAGFAVDRDEASGKYIVTVEIINPEVKGEEVQQVPVVIGSEGDTIFEAIRRIIERTGKRLYWAHTKIMIINKDIAREGIIPVIDLIDRDPETREDIHLIISKEKTAREILHCSVQAYNTVSFQMEGVMNNKAALPRFSDMEIWQFDKLLAEEGISASIAAVDKHNFMGKSLGELHGIAVFKQDRLIGWLNDEETKSYLMITDKVRKGLIVAVAEKKGHDVEVTLKIENSRSELKPAYSNGKLTMLVNIKLDAIIAEIAGSTDFIDKKGREELKKDASRIIVDRIERTVERVQKDYNSDIFGFGSIVHKKKPSLWKKFKPEWDNIFSSMEVKPTVDITLTGSSLRSKPIEAGD